MRARLSMILLLVPLSACAYQSPTRQEANACQILGSKTLIGAFGGAAGGAALGAAAGSGRGAAIGAGIGLLAGMIGGRIADGQDCRAAQFALAANLTTVQNGGTIPWQSASGHSGSYQVTSGPFASHDSPTCRNAVSVPSPGSSEVGKPLIACRMSNGDWNYFES